MPGLLPQGPTAAVTPLRLGATVRPNGQGIKPMNLNPTCRGDGPLSLVESEAARIPFESAMGNDTACLRLKVTNKVFIFYVKHHVCWKDIVPVCHPAVISLPITTQFA